MQHFVVGAGVVGFGVRACDGTYLPCALFLFFFSLCVQKFIGNPHVDDDEIIYSLRVDCELIITAVTVAAVVIDA